MELIVQVLFVLVGLSTLFQMSNWKVLPRFVAALTLGGITYLFYPWVLEQSKDQLSTWMNDTTIMQNLAVVLVIEAMCFIFIDLSLLKKHFGHEIKKIYHYIRYFPGIFLLAVVLYLQMLSFYTLSGIDFDLLGLYFSIVLALLVLATPVLLRWLIPEHALRMELRYILNFGQVLGAIVVTIFCQGLAYPRQEASFEWKPFLFIFGLSIFLALIGWLTSFIRKRIKT